ncbi:MAG TPA: amidase [Usitatibacteraceae bacterium]|nr:amidase [Usitatibacteraceae bacterium]
MEPFALGLRALHAAFREGSLTVQGYVEALNARVARLEPRIQAFEWFEPARALADAEERSGGILRELPLYGIAAGVKDIVATRGIPTRMGSRIFANHVPGRSAGLVRRLEALGGLMYAKTVTTEFAFRHPGKTRNPWNTAHTPGGSSSGSAAAVAAGFVPVAVGTQTLGSVIRPAAFCGVVGYKPSFGAISRDGIFPFSRTLDHVGVFARSVEDAAWFGACLMGQDPRDESTGIRAAMRTLSVPLAGIAAPPRIAVVKTPKWSLASEAQRANFTEAVATLKDAGAQVRDVPLPPAFGEAWTVVQAIMDHDAARGFASIESRHRLQISPVLVALLDRGKRIPPEAHARNLARRDDYRRWLDGLFDGCDAIVTIPAAGEAPEGLANTGDATFCSLWTMAGLPAITLPSGRGPRGLPLGLQVVGRYREDERALQCAAWCERVLGVNLGLAG